MKVGPGRKCTDQFQPTDQILLSRVVDDADVVAVVDRDDDVAGEALAHVEDFVRVVEWDDVANRIRRRVGSDDVRFPERKLRDSSKVRLKMVSEGKRRKVFDGESVGREIVRNVDEDDEVVGDGDGDDDVAGSGRNVSYFGTAKSVRNVSDDGASNRSKVPEVCETFYF